MGIFIPKSSLRFSPTTQNERGVHPEILLKKKGYEYGALEVAYLHQVGKPILPAVFVAQRLQLAYTDKQIVSARQLYEFLVTVQKDMLLKRQAVVFHSPQSAQAINLKVEQLDIWCLSEQIRGVTDAEQMYQANFQSIDTPTDRDLYYFLLTKEKE